MFFKEGCDKEQLNLKVIPLFCTVHHPLRIYKIATSKIVVIFLTSHLKGGTKGPFCNPNAFNSDFDNFTRLKNTQN